MKTRIVSIKGLAGPALCATVFLMLSLICSASAGGVMVRGRLDRQDPRGVTYPANSVVVTLNNPQLGRSPRVYSGNDGMYYFYNVPPGHYTLEIWIGARATLREIDVHGP